MIETATVQGREITGEDVASIRQLMRDNPSWGRRKISMEICESWDWRAANGGLKDMACRSMLLKLEAKGLITLPERKPHTPNHLRNAVVPFVPHETRAISSGLESLAPVEVRRLEGGRRALFSCLLSTYHYLGFSSTVGENMAYMAFDAQERPLACLLFGSAAWKCASRDEFIGWDAARREANVNMTTNNTRFLVLPWVEVPNLASHLLSMVARRISADWQEKYAHPLHMLETFVEQDRFRGTCYKAANWTCVGNTAGRSRNDSHKSMRVPVKDVYVYPLGKLFREALCV